MPFQLPNYQYTDESRWNGYINTGGGNTSPVGSGIGPTLASPGHHPWRLVFTPTGRAVTPSTVGQRLCLSSLLSSLLPTFIHFLNLILDFSQTVYGLWVHLMTYLIYLQIIIAYNQNISESDSICKTMQIMIPCKLINYIMDTNFIDINKHN